MPSTSLSLNRSAGMGPSIKNSGGSVYFRPVHNDCHGCCIRLRTNNQYRADSRPSPRPWILYVHIAFFTSWILYSPYGGPCALKARAMAPPTRYIWHTCWNCDAFGRNRRRIRHEASARCAEGHVASATSLVCPTVRYVGILNKFLVRDPIPTQARVPPPIDVDRNLLNNVGRLRDFRELLIPDNCFLLRRGRLGPGRNCVGMDCNSPNTSGFDWDYRFWSSDRD